MRLITGMHRSGTSLVAQLFYVAGADMGDPQTFYPADRWNPDGYFEQRDIHAINMPLINGPWWKLANFHLPSTRTIMRRAEPMARQIEATGAKYQGKVVKEVRYALTMPAWEKYGTEFESILICLRDPIAAAKSVQKRYRVPMVIGYYLWSEYFTRLMAHVGDRPVWFIRYGHVMKQETFGREMGSALHHLGYDLSPAQLDDLYGRCIKPELNHHRMTTESYPSSVGPLWRDLLRRYDEQMQAYVDLQSPAPIKPEIHGKIGVSAS